LNLSQSKDIPNNITAAQTLANFILKYNDWAEEILLKFEQSENVNEKHTAKIICSLLKSEEE
jgi:hypothetical protein